MLKKGIMLASIALLLLSCGEQPYYQKSWSFTDNAWDQQVKPIFKVDVQDTSKLYDFVLTLRTTTDYPYSNCWIYFNSTTPNKEKAREPFEIKITNPDGTWIGTKSGTIVENNIYFRRRKFPQKGVYFFRIEHGVIQDQLPEVLDIGLRIDEVK